MVEGGRMKRVYLARDSVDPDMCQIYIMFGGKRAHFATVHFDVLDGLFAEEACEELRRSDSDVNDLWVEVETTKIEW
jgi:hypothetical protein